MALPDDDLGGIAALATVKWSSLTIHELRR
jgi:hypothetical protein